MEMTKIRKVAILPHEFQEKIILDEVELNKNVNLTTIKKLISHYTVFLQLF
jgi:hypothetical protein